MPKHPHEQFSMLFGMYNWDVALAWTILERSGREKAQGGVNVAALSRAQGETEAYTGTEELRAKLLADAEVDPDVPLLFLAAPLGHEGRVIDLLIDGRHRLAKALLLGRETVPALKLTAQDARHVELGGRDRARWDEEWRHACGAEVGVARVKGRTEQGFLYEDSWVTDGKTSRVPLTTCPGCHKTFHLRDLAPKPAQAPTPAPRKRARARTASAAVAAEE